MAADYVQKHIAKKYQFPPAYDHYSYFSALNTSDRVLGVAWIGTACLKWPLGKILVLPERLMKLLFRLHYIV